MLTGRAPFDGCGSRSAAGEHLLCLLAEKPAASLGNADGDNIVFLLVDSGKHGGGGAERDFMLARTATKDDPDAEFPGHRCGQSNAVVAQASVTRNGEVYLIAIRKASSRLKIETMAFSWSLSLPVRRW